MPWFEDESLPELAPVEPPCAPEDDEPPVEPEPPVTDELPSAPVPDEPEVPEEPDDDEPPIAPDEPALDEPPDAPDEPVLAEPDSDEPLMLEFDEPVDDEPVDDDNPDADVPPAPIDDEPLAPLDDPLRPPLLPAPLLEPVDGLALCDELPDRLPDEALLLLFRLLDLSSLPMLLPLLLASTPFPSLDF